MSRQPSDGGLALLSGPDAEGLLAAVAAERGWSMQRWSLNHVDHDPNRSTTATYSVRAITSRGLRRLLVGLTCRTKGPSPRDEKARLFERDGVQVAAWVYPDDPDLPGLPAITHRDKVSELLAEAGLIESDAAVEVSMITYRPRRRAVVRLQSGARAWFAKSMRPNRAQATVHRHEVLSRSSTPTAQVDAFVEDQGLLLLRELPGDPLARAIFEANVPVAGERIIDLLDGLPAAAADLPRKPSWASMIGHYADLIVANLPAEENRLNRLLNLLDGVVDDTDGHEPTHGDFHEGQIFVADGRITGLLDVDGLGPGRRVDDLACLVAHLSTVQRMTPAQAARVRAVLDAWLPVFDERVDAAELRLRSAAVVITLATGPFRAQETSWQRETAEILDAAERLVTEAG